MPTEQREPYINPNEPVPSRLSGRRDDLSAAISYLDSGLLWSTTSEGRAFWHSISERLRAYRSNLPSRDSRSTLTAVVADNQYPELQGGN